MAAIGNGNRLLQKTGKNQQKDANPAIQPGACGPNGVQRQINEHYTDPAKHQGNRLPDERGHPGNWEQNQVNKSRKGPFRKIRENDGGVMQMIKIDGFPIIPIKAQVGDHQSISKHADKQQSDRIEPGGRDNLRCGIFDIFHLMKLPGSGCFRSQHHRGAIANYR